MMSIFKLGSPLKTGTFDIYESLQQSLQCSGTHLEPGDVVVVSTKYVSVSQGRIAQLEDTGVSEEARRMAVRFRLDQRVSEIILRESDHIMGGISGFVLAYAAGVMAPNAGIDSSNAKSGTVIMYPAHPDRAAELLRRKIYLNSGVMTGIILADSRLMPGRVGTTGLAVACAGIEPTLDMRGHSDLMGRPLKVTIQAVADSLATAANYTMSEGAQATPFAVIRGSGATPAHRPIPPSRTAVNPAECVYIRGLSSSEHVPVQPY